MIQYSKAKSVPIAAYRSINGASYRLDYLLFGLVTIYVTSGLGEVPSELKRKLCLAQNVSKIRIGGLLQCPRLPRTGYLESRLNTAQLWFFKVKSYFSLPKPPKSMKNQPK